MTADRQHFKTELIEERSKLAYTLKMKKLPVHLKVTELSKKLFREGATINKEECALNPKGQGFAVIAWKDAKVDTLFIDLIPAFNCNDGKPRVNKEGKPYYIFTQEQYDYPECIPKDINWASVAVESPEPLGKNSGAIHAYSVMVLQLSGRMPKTIKKQEMFGLGIFKGGSHWSFNRKPLLAEFRNRSANLNNESIEFNRELLLANYYSPPNSTEINPEHEYYIRRVLVYDISKKILECLLNELFPYQSIRALDKESKDIYHPGCIAMQLKGKLLIANWIEGDDVRASTMMDESEIEDKTILTKLPKPGAISTDINLIRDITLLYPVDFTPTCALNYAAKTVVEKWWDQYYDDPVEKNRRLMQTVLSAIVIQDKNANKLIEEIIPLMKRNHRLIESSKKANGPLFVMPPKECTLLTFAIERAASASIIHQLIEASPDLINDQESLTAAVRQDNLNAIKILIEAKANLNTAVQNGDTPLVVAAYYGHYEIIKTLLAAKADPNQVTLHQQKATPLCCAVFRGHHETVKILLNANADPNKVMQNGDSPLLLAVQHEYPSLVKILLDAKAEPDWPNESDNTPLCSAAYRGQHEIIKILLNAKADPNKTRRDTVTPLYCAVYNNLHEVAKTLLDAKAAPDVAKKDGDTPLLSAASKGFDKSIKILLDAKADPNKARKDTITPLFFAAFHEHHVIVKMLLEAKADLCYQQNATYLAAQHNSKNLTEMLLAQGFDFKKKNKEGLTPFLVAVNNRSMDVLKLLLQHTDRFDINAVSAGPTHPFASAASIAAENGDIATLKLLAKFKVDLAKPRANDGATLLHSAAKNGHLHAVRWLLEQNLNSFALDNAKHSALYYAIRNKHWLVVRYLIQKVNPKLVGIKDRKLIQRYQKEIVWTYYESTAYSTKQTGRSPIVAMLMQSSSLFKRQQNNFLIENRYRNLELQEAYDKVYGLVIKR